ncbi:hypothetical protein DICPUDRAFT_86943 [Dictyostelium purpureum]|uniref:Uncharacterized protein n=1 Tax=Dictyostelium purpureum TaxID=5786 RepID=F0ZEY1_DICPU|nr:uncharacterized protein DICPUDRAFT_86943 [Dictyostelium purpureum]EGC37510.1 hypothetical protein DICPUDRAFT_86943 [Dictyostelium purpureum]|eukprot:XP_003285984.1 hypothetical protein DICPUDRAFT_86943 [Dictyostelium purpureum]
MNDTKSNEVIKPKISTELDDGDNKLYSFESNYGKSFTFENGQLKEHNENSTVTKGNEHGSISKKTEKNTQFQKPLPPTPNDKEEANNPVDFVADNLGLKHLNKNPNVGPEQYFTSFQKFVPKNNTTDPLPDTKK